MSNNKVSPALQAIAKDAIQVQDACNLSGVAQLLTKATKVLWEEVNAGRGNGTDFVNTHPVTKLIVNKLSWLAGSESGYLEAHDSCMDLANAELLESLGVPVGACG